jgi:hypothetical protein
MDLYDIINLNEHDAYHFMRAISFFLINSLLRLIRVEFMKVFSPCEFAQHTISYNAYFPPQFRLSR